MTTIPVLPAAPTGQMLGLLSELSFTQLTNDALRNYQSTLALSRSPLANSPLVTPTLVKDEASPTVEERGHGLRLVLQWAVNQLAPGAPAYPVGDYRPLDDPTWRDPHWWRYNILRHRYLEPLHPDDFVGGGRYTESLLALTGISSADAFFDERNRAIRAVAERLRQQLIDGQASNELQHLALQEAMLPLEKATEAARLLGIAATFDNIFPRPLVVEIAAQEGIYKPALLLDDLIRQRFLLTGDEGASLWLAPILRAYVYERQSKIDSQRRHRFIAAYYEAEDDPLPAAHHWQRAGQDARAVRVLLPVAEELIHELQIKELIEFFQQIDPKQLATDQQYTVHLLVSDLFQRSGQQEEALAACRQALQTTTELCKQARVYRRMGKLYESRNQLHALRYYQHAVERFAPTDPELAELLKDRGWLHCLRKEWSQAEADLQQALATVAPLTGVGFLPPPSLPQRGGGTEALPTPDRLPPQIGEGPGGRPGGDTKNLPQKAVASGAQGLCADIYDAMASLHRETNRHQQALRFAERALALREELGDPMRVAKSLGNLGLLYRAMGEYGPATAAYTEAMSIYQKLGNQELTAVAWLNIGVAHFIPKKLDAAITAYRQSLSICQEINLPLIAIKAHYNLAEAYAAHAAVNAALEHWQAGYQLCQQHNFDDQEALFLTLRRSLQLPSQPEAIHANQPINQQRGLPPLDADEQLVVTLVAAERTVTPKRLMDAAAISRATATRWLTALVEKGVLAVEGKGRGTYYYLAEQAPTPPAAPGSVAEVAIVADVDSAAIGHALQPYQAELAQCYGVTGIGVLPQAAAASLLQLIVCFATLPTLPEYRQLKRRLTQLLQRDLDLLLEDEVPPTVPPSSIWLWPATA